MTTSISQRIREMTEYELRELISEAYSLDCFEDLKKVVRYGHIIKVYGLIDLNCIPERFMDTAIKVASDGFLYCVDSYDLSTDEVVSCGMDFMIDPWLHS